MSKKIGIKKEVILEHAGIKIGDTVKLIGVQMPRTPGKVISISKDKKTKSPFEVLYTILVKNEDDYNHPQHWPIYRSELEKA